VKSGSASNLSGIHRLLSGPSGQFKDVGTPHDARPALRWTVLSYVVGALFVAATAVLMTQVAGARGATTPATTIAATATAPATAQQPVVVLGDSVPAATGCDCDGFAADVASTLSGPLTNMSIPGLNSNGLVAQLHSARAENAVRGAKVVIITIGANDFDDTSATSACVDLSCYAGTVRTVTANVDSILTRVKATAPSGSRIVVTGYWNVFLDGKVGAAKGATYVAISNQLTRKVNTNLAKLSKAHSVLYTDIYSAFKGRGDLDDTALLASDGDHPDASGHKLIANAIRATLRANS
jgi:lysophospholipase L1-like esterase